MKLAPYFNPIKNPISRETLMSTPLSPGSQQRPSEPPTAFPVTVFSLVVKMWLSALTRE